MQDKDLERPPGFTIQVSRRPVALGQFHPSHLLIEWFAKGRYWFGRFLHREYLWPDLEVEAMIEDDSHTEDDASAEEVSDEERDIGGEDDDEEGLFFPEAATGDRQSQAHSAKQSRGIQDRAVVFDKHNQTDVSKLNNWRREVFKRVLGETIQSPPQPWTKAERDFLFQLWQELYDEWKARFPRHTRQEIVLALAITSARKDEWAGKLNRKFGGTTMEGETFPRRDRTGLRVSAARARDARIGILFRFKMDPVFVKRLDPAEQAKYEAQRDQLEAADEVVTRQYIADHPHEADPERFPRPRTVPGSKRKRVEQQGGEAVEADDSDEEGRPHKK